MRRAHLTLTAVATLLLVMTPVAITSTAEAAPRAGGCVVIVVNNPDIDGDGNVGMTDLLELLSCWGWVPIVTCQPSNLVDVINCGAGNSVDEVDIRDLLTLFANWG